VMQFYDNKNIYLQLAENLVEGIVEGKHPPGQKIPSVRELAAEVGVNPNTVMRTYSELQSKGIIENKRGIGYFVTADATTIVLEQKREEFFRSELPRIQKQLALLGIDYPTLQKHLENLNNGNHHENK